jgi:hypothetical protein
LYAPSFGWLAAQPLSRPPRPAERAFQVAERLGSVNAAAAELGTTWPLLRKSFTRHGLGMPARNPQAVRQRATEAARQRSGRPATPSLDPVFVALHHGELPVRARSDGELAERVRRAEDYAVLGARVVVELHTESHATTPTTRAWAITRRADRAHRLVGQRAPAPSTATRSANTAATAPTDPVNLRNGGWLPMPTDPNSHRPQTPSTPADSSCPIRSSALGRSGWFSWDQAGPSPQP